MGRTTHTPVTSIEVRSAMYDKVRTALADAMTTLGKNRGTLTSAVPGEAFGLLGALVPPASKADGDGAKAVLGR